MNAQIANAVIDGMNSQIQLIQTLASGVCGGIAALLLQVVLHNHKKDVEEIRFWHPRFLWVALTMEGLSIVGGFLAMGAVTGSIPSIFRIASEDIENWTVTSQHNLGGGIEVLATVQFALFVLGILVVSTGLYRSLKRS